MKIDEFIRQLIYKGIAITPYPTSFYHWDSKAIMKYLTRYVDYHCGNPPTCVTKARPRCCCGYCAYNIGYLHEVPARLDVLFIYASLFKEDVGFWSKKGCVLPRPLRSSTCLTYNCHPNKMSPADRLLLDILHDGLKNKEIKRRIRAFIGLSPMLLVDTFANEYLRRLDKPPIDYDLFGNLIKRTIKKLGSNYDTIYKGVRVIGEK